MTEEELKTIAESFKDNIMAFKPLLECSSHFYIDCYSNNRVRLSLFNDLTGKKFLVQDIIYEDNEIRYESEELERD